MILRTFKVLLNGLGILIALLLIAGTYLAWISRDIPVAELEQRYGGEGLQRVTVDGVNIAYKVEGAGPPLVLIHSHFYTMRLWQPWVKVLARDFTVIRYDLTSHGLTGPDPSADYTRARGTLLLAELLDHLGIEQASVAGSSTGGALAWYFAAHYPQRVDKLILINAPGMPRVTNKYMERGLPAWGGYAFYLLPEKLFTAFLQAAVIDNTLVTHESVKEFHEMYRRKGNRMAEFKRMMAWERGDISKDLALIHAPTLIMWGEQNPQLPKEHVAQYTQKLINAASVDHIIYPNIGHVIPLEIPQQSAEDVRTFLAGM
ncbi:MAG: pimeloyl-ACP methyl ester carboxylesterase [Halieaceae bacterium]